MKLSKKIKLKYRTREPGVLILSPFAGAGGMMHEALLVNPYEVAAYIMHCYEVYMKMGYEVK